MSSTNQPSKSVQSEVRRYLIDLQSAAAVAAPPLDAALIHDILADAEDHLLSAVAAGKPAAEAIAEFGEPAEIIAAYRQAQPAASAWTGMPGIRQAAVVPRTKTAAATTTGIPADPWEGTQTPKPLDGSALARIPVLGIWFTPMAWRAVAFLIVGYALAIVSFTVMVAGLSVAVGTLPLLIGPPLLVGVLGLARVLSLAHGRLIEIVLGIRMPRRQAAMVTHGVTPFLARVWMWLKDVRSWTSVAFLIGNFPIATLLFSVIITLLPLGLGLFLGPILHYLFGTSVAIHTVNGRGGPAFELFGRTFVPDPLTGNINLPAWMNATIALTGFVVLTATLWVSLGAAWVYASVVKAIQVSRPITAA